MINLNEYLNHIHEQDEKQYCIGVDLDGTLAHYEGWNGFDDIGEPILPMLSRVKHWITKGIRVIIFTARATEPNNIPPIKEWLKKNGLPDLEITCVKKPEMKLIFDDRAIQVEKNTGKILSNYNEEFGF